MGIEKSVKDQFIKNYPQWAHLASTVYRDGEEIITIEIPSPSSTHRGPLSIDTFGDEITISFDAYHIHVDEYSGNGYDNAWIFVNKVVSYCYAVVSYWREEKWCGSRLLSKDEFPSDNGEYPYASSIRIRSWSGALDSDIICVPRG